MTARALMVNDPATAAGDVASPKIRVMADAELRALGGPLVSPTKESTAPLPIGAMISVLCRRRARIDDAVPLNRRFAHVQVEPRLRRTLFTFNR